MQLLFNKIYLKIDHLFKSERNRINISPRLQAAVLAGGFRQTANQIPAVAPLYHAESYSQLIEESFGGQEDAFIRTLVNYPSYNRLTIYCSIDAYVAISTRFWKTVYPQLNADDYFRLVNFLLSPLYELLAHHKSRESELTDAQANELRNDIDAVFASEDQLKAEWSTIKPYKLAREQREIVLKGAGIEYHLPTILSVPTWRHGNNAKKRIVDMMHKEALAEFNEDVKHLLLNHLENIHTIDPTVKYDALTTSLEEFVATYPKYQFLADLAFTPDNYQYVLRTYDLAELESIRLAVLEYDGFETECCGIPLKNNLTFDDIIEFERIGTMGRLLGNVGEYREKVNSYLIDYVLTQYFTGNTTALQPYVMR